MSAIRRTTKETDVRLSVTLGSSDPTARIDADAPFLVHMLETLSRYAGIDLEVEATGDLEHHLVEDVAITLGTALRRACPDSVRRYGEATVPMDDAVVHVVLDVGGRAFYRGPLPDGRWEHFFRSLADNAAWTLHARVLRGEDRHHVIEAAFKALGLAMRESFTEQERGFSTKGAVRWELPES